MKARLLIFCLLPLLAACGDDVPANATVPVTTTANGVNALPLPAVTASPDDWNNDPSWGTTPVTATGTQTAAQTSDDWNDPSWNNNDPSWNDPSWNTPQSDPYAQAIIDGDAGNPSSQAPDTSTGPASAGTTNDASAGTNPSAQADASGSESSDGGASSDGMS